MNVIPLPVNPHYDAIEAVSERLAEIVASGDISSLAVAFVTRDGTIDSMWSPATPVAPLLGALSRLIYRLNEKMNEEDE